MKKIAVFVSGRGSNFASILKEIQNGAIPAEICCVISDHPHPPAFDIAREARIATHWIGRKQFKEPSDYADFLLALLGEYGIDLIVLAGYMKLIPSPVVHNYPNAIMNIHPALLPNFGGKGYYGVKVHEAVLSSGVKITGVTVHFVDEHYDTGPVILQERIDVFPDDTAETLAKRVLELEHRVFPAAVKAFCEDRLSIKNREVVWQK